MTIAAILIVATVAVYINPEYSWSNSFRDTDGDSVSDAEDAWPDNPAMAVAHVSASSTYADEVWTISIKNVSNAEGVTSIPAKDVLVEARGGHYGESHLSLTHLELMRDGPIDGVKFTDSDQNDRLSKGDSFQLDMPAFVNGGEFGLSKARTSFIGGNPLSYCYVKLEYPLLKTPQLSAEIVNYLGGYRYTFSEPVIQTIHWGEVLVMMDPTVGWRLDTRDFVSSSSVSVDLGAHYYDSQTQFHLIVTDTGGNGAIDMGDYFSITAQSTSNESTLYDVYLLYLPTGSYMLRSGFPFAP